MKGELGGEKVEFLWKWASVKQALGSRQQASGIGH